VKQLDKINIGLLGCGHIGMGVNVILDTNRSVIESSLGCTLEIKKILVRNLAKYKGKLGIPDIFTVAADEILLDPEIHIVVELIGGIHPAYEYIRKALEQRKHVVTANKAVIALYGQELMQLAVDMGVSIRFEGSVGGGIPVIASMTRSLAGNQIEEIVGIINGTTNYILTKMDEEGLGFEEALKEAQEKGFAEADPSSDLDGVDAAFKLSILIYTAFGIQVNPDDIPREGIRRISEREMEYAKQLGYKVKLLASVKKNGGGFEMHVHPTLVPLDHPLAAVNNEYNALFIKGNAVGELMLYGKGAGSLPTGSAVMGDIMEIVRIINNPPRESDNYCTKEDLKAKLIGEGTGAYYIRFQVTDRPGVLGKITTAFGKNGISLESVVQRSRGKSSVPLVFVTHEVKREMLDTALKEIEAMNTVEEVASILMVKKRA
jgi:homoserine dehydrogenase